MSEDELSYVELKSRLDELQRQAARSLLIGQDLIDAKNRLDRDMTCFRAIHAYCEKAIKTSSFEDFAQATIESVIEAFEVESSALLAYSPATDCLNAMAAFGCERLEGCRELSTEWMEAKGYLHGRSAFIESIETDTHPWFNLGLSQMILSPFEHGDGSLRGFVLAGTTRKNQAYYDEFTPEILPSFMVFSQQMNSLLTNLESMEHLERTVQLRTEELEVANEELTKINEDLGQEIGVRKTTENKLRRAEKEAKELSKFLKKMFGRYLSAEVMESLLQDPSALELGGELRDVTILMSDVRGFTATSERLKPAEVVTMLNSYCEVMVEVVHRYGGTIIEIAGDSLLIVFGAPQAIPDRAQRAIACAVSMQNAMGEVNDTNRKMGLPELDMVIALHDTEVIVGNIGSSERIKYSVVGTGVNLASRIESYAVGGQILVSESVCREAGDVLRIDGQRDVLPKGFETALRIYEVGGIAGEYNLALERGVPELIDLSQQLPLRYALLEGKHVGREGLEGHIIRLSKQGAEVDLHARVDRFRDLKMNLKEVYEELAVKDFYAKVISRSGKEGSRYLIRFTSIPLEVASYFLAHQQLNRK
jgi:class 3 adenylate cyclase